METNKNQRTPRARQAGLLFSPLNDELVIYDIERDQAHSLNRTTRLIWEHCDGRTTVRQLAELLARELQLQVDEQVVWLALQQLDRSHLLQPAGALPQAKISRRELARRLGLAAAVALPLVTSLAIPPAVAAVSALACTFNFECPPGFACQAGVCVSGPIAPGAPSRAKPRKS